jgi:hypothetical protein
MVTLQFIDIPNYTYKVLPQGIYQLAENDFYNFFVSLFPESLTRSIIYQKYTDLRTIFAKYLNSTQ